MGLLFNYFVDRVVTAANHAFGVRTVAAPIPVYNSEAVRNTVTKWHR